MRILLLNEVAAFTGGEMNYYVTDVATRLAATGDTVALVHGRVPRSEYRGTGYLFDHLRRMGASREEVRVRLEAILDDFAPEVIQIHGVPNLALDAWLARRAPTLRWVHNHQLYCSGQRMTWAWPRRVCTREHGPGCLAAHLTRGCGSPNPADNLVRYRQVSRSLAHLRTLPGIQVASRMMADNLIHNGIDPARIRYTPLYAPAPEATVRPPQRPFILHAGGLVRQKGVWLMLRLLQRLDPAVDIVFAGGSGPLETPLREAVARQGLSKRVRIVGEVSLAQWSRLFSQASLVAVPSLWNEPLGLAGLYAMAHGKPVVAFRCAGINEWLEDGVTGVAVPFGQQATFIEATARLLENPARCEQLGARALEHWKARFRPEHHLEALRNTYRHALETASEGKKA